MPKVELHMHVEGAMEPELMLKLAARNKYKLPYSSLEEIKKAYCFNNLNEFIDIFIQGTNVVQSEQDLYDICMSYFDICKQQNILHTEVHCDIRTYVDKGFPAEMVINSLEQAFIDAKSQHGITGGFMPCFIRHLGPELAEEDWKLLKPFSEKITAIGLSAKESGFPPSLFKKVFKKVHEQNIKVIAHAGEETPPEYIWSAINDIQVDRIDHGVQCLNDSSLVDYLVEKQTPLTVCPQSNISLNVFDTMADHPLTEMFNRGLNVSIHSDDPAHFNSYLSENIISIFDASDLNLTAIIQMNKNAINSGFTTEQRKNELHSALNNYLHKFNFITP